MKKINRFKILSFALVAAYLLSACGGGAVPQSGSPDNPLKVQANEVAFMGTVEAISGDQWTISGQVVKIDPQTSIDPNIKVGDVVKVEGSVAQDGTVVAAKVEATVPDDTAGNSNTGNDNGANTNDDIGNSNDNQADNSNSGTGNTNDNGSGVGAPEKEVFGVVEAITADTITVDGVEYSLASFTEFKDAIAVGDQVKVHVIVNLDGTFTIREIEKSAGTSVDDNGNSNFNGDDNSNSSNGNANDDAGGNSNDDDHGGGNSNSGGGGGGHGGNSNDDKDDDKSNDNG